MVPWVFITVMLAACGPLFVPAPGENLPASEDPSPMAAGVVGCWVLHWSTPDGDLLAPLGTLPDSVSLEGAPFFGERGRLVAPATAAEGRRDPGGMDSDDVPWEETYPVSRWWADGPVVALVFSMSDRDFWSAELRGVDGDRMEGTARPFGQLGFDGEAAVDARRIECGFLPEP